MKIIDARVDIITDIIGINIIKGLELIGRICYKSEDYITGTSAIRFVENLIKNGHEAILEHCNITVKFICDRGVSHQIVRHRLASYAQESTRYCNYSKDKFGKEITVIRPCFWDYHSAHFGEWEVSCRKSEKAYFTLLENGATPEQARSVLPNSLKTELVTTMNLREWRHFFKVRTGAGVHPQMLELTVPLLHRFTAAIPVIFDDI